MPGSNKHRMTPDRLAHAAARVARAAGGQIVRVTRTRAESSYECRIGSTTFARTTILALETRGVLRRIDGGRGPSRTYTLTREREKVT